MLEYIKKTYKYFFFLLVLVTQYAYVNATTANTLAQGSIGFTTALSKVQPSLISVTNLWISTNFQTNDLNVGFSHDKPNKMNIGLLVFVFVLLVVIIILVWFIRLLLTEIKVSTHDYVSNLNQMKKSSLQIDMNHPLIKKVFSSMPVMMFINDMDGNIRHASSDFIADYCQSEIMPDDFHLSQVFDSDLVKLLQAQYQNLESGKGSISVEPIKIHLNNETHLKWIVKMPVHLLGLNNTFILNFVTSPIIESDASTQRVTPDYFFQSVIDALPYLIFLKNTNGVYIGANKAFYKFSGKSVSEVLGKFDHEIFENNKSDEYKQSDDIVFNKGITWNGQEWANSADGDLVKFENIKIPLHDKMGRIFGLVGISHDLTTQYRHEQELALAKEKAEESVRIKSSFLANMSHEVRTPMNSIIGFSDLLADPDLTIDQRMEIIDLIQANGHMLIDLIDDIIDFSRIESKQVHFKFSNFNLNSIFRDAYEYGVNKKNQFNKEHLNIAYAIGSVEDEFIIYSDPFRLRQVLKNLLSTAIRFSTSESLFLGYIVNNESIIVYVKNDSAVLSQDLIDKISTNKSTIMANFSEIEESAGIAIIIAKNVIEMLNGNLFREELVLGRPDFFFSLPFKKIEPKHIPKMDQTELNIPDWTGKCILIAEDEEINFMLLEGILDRTNAELIHARNGEEAIQKFKDHSHKINLVLMDIRMPKINGVEATRKIIELKNDTIILAQTAYVMPEDKEQYINVGMKTIISKPIDPTELYFVCNKYLV